MEWNDNQQREQIIFLLERVRNRANVIIVLLVLIIVLLGIIVF
jgi:predicted nucleic acid-binding Zn ribbon protein